MICKNIITNKEYNYTFIEDGKVFLENENEAFSINYEDWCFDYFIIDKWRKLKIEK